MIRASTADPIFNKAYLNAFRAMPVERLETPRQYGARWREMYRCRIEPAQQSLPHSYYIFDQDADYLWFILKWS
jgi:hypothetical protein